MRSHVSATEHLRCIARHAHDRNSLEENAMSNHTDPLVNAVHPVLEMLEARRLLCLAYEVDEHASTDVPPGYAAPEGGGADIIWVNRGQASDGFSVFGAQAETAR